MSHRLLPFLAPGVLLLLAACGGSSTGSGSSNVPIDQAPNVTRKAASAVDPASVTAAVAANNAFAFDLYSHVLSQQTTPANVLTSPISASLALTMTYAGAQGQTATQMASALHFGSASPSAIFDGQNALSAALASRAASAFGVAQQQTSNMPDAPAPSRDDYVVQVINSVWGENTYPWATPFLTTLAQSYGTGVFLEDFLGQPDPARLAINAWVSTQTGDKINNLLSPGAIDGTTRMVLVNAIHMKLPWEIPFPTTATQNASFARADGSTVTAPFMNQTEEGWPYVDDGKAQVIAAPLGDGSLEVVFAMPHGDLASYEAQLTSGQATLNPPPGTANIALSVPKFTFTSPSFSLASELQAMGMTQAFDPSAAQFQGMCAQTPDGDNLFIGDVVQKATLAVQETGVEAAAATAVILAGSAAPAQPVPLTLNHPFVVAIVDQPTGAILFLGHIEDPTAAGSQ
jgi:serpin B